VIVRMLSVPYEGDGGWTPERSARMAREDALEKTWLRLGPRVIAAIIEDDRTGDGELFWMLEVPDCLIISDLKALLEAEARR